jgi:hypothetical protein
VLLLLLLTSRLIQPDFTIGAAADDSTAASTTAGAFEIALAGGTVACPQEKHGRVIQLADIAGPSLSR